MPAEWKKRLVLSKKLNNICASREKATAEAAAFFHTKSCFFVLLWACVAVQEIRADVVKVLDMMTDERADLAF